MFDVIIVAAGSGKRMNLDKNKQLLKIKNKPILAWSIEQFYNNDRIDNIIIAIREQDRNEINDILKEYNFENIHLVPGGKERQDSIHNCINKLDELLKKQVGYTYTQSDRYLIIHDGARPFIDKEIINRTIEETKIHNSICIGVPSKDTIKIIDDEKIICQTPKRESLWCAQTPQSFRLDIIFGAYKNAYEKGFIGTDDASLVENMGSKVKMVIGSYENIKVTTIEDLIFAENIAKNRL
ncbi:2-C-methyl-D-erythritol 4-phosphate cytidylyltransferase [Peptostreptococcus canis]|uniref:2-C-methyl-D-erythritol 4-phosphate cytidylyltransferase n=1 Tax=Peptostreptococcus canis TaxID=1159213 RepID=A0ABR6TN69_9FIRM|nr:2-C-methyl-D-erythritol 4-phosphate cytidylyltransferase [Peptostreptococcus canis]MBC2576609.1 2-C-methyl-D-erythritol 4-phosphate cytidylyltransferase [Peptostreptococcus canis]MBP1998796.1 2-C-methyl-D-erythritol 4-phosphate cytidylyltransferase [Peptostreptococcus canis]